MYTSSTKRVPRPYMFPRELSCVLYIASLSGMQWSYCTGEFMVRPHTGERGIIGKLLSLEVPEKHGRENDDCSSCADIHSSIWLFKIQL
jgi:hypothetical protein